MSDSLDTPSHPQVAGDVCGILWDLLPSLEELSAATRSVLQLLAALHAGGGGSSAGRDLTALVPRLFPFLRHTLLAARQSALQCLHSLLTPGAAGAASHAAQPPAWLPPLLHPLLRCLMQHLLAESDARALELGREAWGALLAAAAPNALAAALNGLLATFLALAATPAAARMDLAALVPPAGSQVPF